jgi:hypothetical protein
MADDMSTVPVGSVIVAAVKDEGSKRLSQAAKDIFISMGAKEINNIAYRESYLFMGVKGSKQNIERRGKTGSESSATVVLGYSTVTKRVKKTKTITQTK